MNLAAKISLDSSAFQSGLRAALGSLGSFAGAVINPMAIAAGAIASVGAAATAVGVGIKKAASMEELEMSFVTLLGSASAAKDRLEELSKFAATTPFDLPGIGKASKILQSLTGNALSTGEGLRMVGDMAAMAGAPIDDLAVTVGRLHSGLMSGKAVGEAAARLSQLGLMSAATRDKLEKLQAAGKKGSEVWQVAAADFAKFSGEMERKSQGWNGLMSTLKDNISMAFAAFGQPIMDVLKPYLSDAVGLTDKLVEGAGKFGETIATGVALFAEAWANGSVADIIFAALKTAFYAGVNYLIGAIKSAAEVIFNLFTDSSFWGGIVETAKGSFGMLRGVLMEIFLTPLAYLQAGIKKAVAEAMELLSGIPLVGDHMGLPEDFKARSYDEYLQDAKRDLRKSAQDTFSGGGEVWSSGTSKLFDAFSKNIAEAVKNFSPADLADSDKVRKELLSKIDPLLKVIEERKKQAEKSLAKNDAQTPEAASSGVFAEKGLKGDSLSRIGGYVGFVGGQNYAYAKKTADNTEKMVKQQLKTNQLLEKQNSGTSGAAVWAGA